MDQFSPYGDEGEAGILPRGAGCFTSLLLFLSLALLLDHASHAGIATDVRAAVEAALADHSVELTDRGTPEHGTASVTQVVCDHLLGPA